MMQGQEKFNCLKHHMDKTSHSNSDMESGDKSIINGGVESHNNDIQKEAHCECQEELATETDCGTLQGVPPAQGIELLLPPEFTGCSPDLATQARSATNLCLGQSSACVGDENNKMPGQQTISCLEPITDNVSHSNSDIESGEKEAFMVCSESPSDSVHNDVSSKCEDKLAMEADRGTVLEEISPSALHGKTWQDDPAVLEWSLHEEKPSDKEGWKMTSLEQTLPQPVMYCELLWRDWEDLCDAETICGKHFDFSVLSYNILSQDLADQNPELYHHCDSSILQWDYRWPNILQELQHWEADIICLQEVQENHYREQVHPSLSAMGYSCHFKRRTGRKTDGCCTCFKTDRFMLLCESHIEFFRPGIDLLNRDNVGLVVLLKPITTLGQQEEHSQVTLSVANTHLLYNPRRGDIKLAQLALLLAEVDKLSRTANGTYCPIILCGDMNTTPGSPLYRLIRNGYLRFKDLPAWKVSGQEHYCNLNSSRLLPPYLWPDILGVTDTCQYAALLNPKSQDKLAYSRQQLLQLRYCECALRRPRDLTLIKGVTDNEPGTLVVSATQTQHHTLIGKDVPAVLSEAQSTLLSSPFLLRHNLNLTSVYSHFLPTKSRPEVTTIPLGIGSTVDYIFYSAEPVPEGSASHGIRFYQDSKLKLLGRLCLLSEDDLWAAQGLPNPFYCSDHLSLLARFSLDLSTP